MNEDTVLCPAILPATKYMKSVQCILPIRHDGEHASLGGLRWRDMTEEEKLAHARAEHGVW